MSAPVGFDHDEAACRIGEKYRTDNVAWVRWPGWTLWPGCDRCLGDPLTAGPMEPCFGKAACHGLDAGCGCVQCYETVRQACLDVLAARGHAAPVTR